MTQGDEVGPEARAEAEVEEAFGAVVEGHRSVLAEAEVEIERAWLEINREAREGHGDHRPFDPEVVAQALVRMARIQEGLDPE